MAAAVGLLGAIQVPDFPIPDAYQGIIHKILYPLGQRQQAPRRWTLELLASEMVRLTEHPNVSRETVIKSNFDCRVRPSPDAFA